MTQVCSGLSSLQRGLLLTPPPAHLPPVSFPSWLSLPAVPSVYHFPFLSHPSSDIHWALARSHCNGDSVWLIFLSHPPCFLPTSCPFPLRPSFAFSSLSDTHPSLFFPLSFPPSLPSLPLSGDQAQRRTHAWETPNTFYGIQSGYHFLYKYPVSIQISKSFWQWSLKFSFSQTRLTILNIKLIFPLSISCLSLITSTTTWLLESLGHKKLLCYLPTSTINWWVKLPNSSSAESEGLNHTFSLLYCKPPCL